MSSPHSRPIASQNRVPPFPISISDFTYEVLDFKADVFGDAAVTMFYFQYKAKLGDASIAGRLRGTLVFVKVDTSWKITPEHFSEFPPNPA